MHENIDKLSPLKKGQILFSRYMVNNDNNSVGVIIRHGF